MPPKQVLFVKLHPKDNVVIATQSLGLGSRIDGIDVLDAVPSGHKVAIKSIPFGTEVRKYGQVIGYANTDISKGQHVHIHNLQFRASNAEHQIGQSVLSTDGFPAVEPRTFDGYLRENGKVGTRNFIAVLTSVNCSASAARLIADHFRGNALAGYPNVDGVAAFVHGTGCAMDPNGDGYANLQRVLWGYASHANCGGILLVGLGCESYQTDALIEAYGIVQNDRFRVMNIQDMGGLRKTINAGIAVIEEMLPRVNEAQRSPHSISALTLGLQCGGSDAWSGITANPALGHASDLLIRHGGTAVLAETPEVYGAEHLLTRRARSAEVADKLIQRLHWWEDYTARNHGSMDNNPSPGNKRGGLTTILEKSLGAVAKSGTLPMEDVLRYGEPITCKGFVMMDSPGYDPASITGQIASGCNIVAFTTGRGSVYGSKPAPAIKIATNTAMYQRMQEDMDVNAGVILDGDKSVAEVGEAILDLLVNVASGRPSLSEAQGLGDLEFVPWQIGAVM
ncbi:MAG: altronate dehydratase [Gammaproteobacteria bacterium]|nr:altronate dehydratase [Gammaproteobacteria bacterium]